jgi:CYTH domain-containing protein
MNKSGEEIERRFLVKLPEFKLWLGDNFNKLKTVYDISQWYMDLRACPGKCVRLRQTKTNVLYQYYMTFKASMESDFLNAKRKEDEIEIDCNQYLKMRTSCDFLIDKKRFVFDVKTDIYEYDIIKLGTDELHVVEVEFDNMTECTRFVPEPWFGMEITHMKELSNVQLAYHGIPKYHEVQKYLTKNLQS